jgi:hypothetical protein
VKCHDCKHSATAYDMWGAHWRAICHRLGGAQPVSEYTEDEDTVPVWDVDLGQSSSYCPYHIYKNEEVGEEAQ